MLADRFVKDPREVVKTGDLVKVKVMEVDLERRRIALSMRLGADSRERVRDIRSGPGSKPKAKPMRGKRPEPSRPPEGGAMASALAQALKKRK
jgi:uncharacterized protein